MNKVSPIIKYIVWLLHVLIGRVYHIVNGVQHKPLEEKQEGLYMTENLEEKIDTNCKKVNESKHMIYMDR